MTEDMLLLRSGAGLLCQDHVRCIVVCLEGASSNGLRSSSISDRPGVVWDCSVGILSTRGVAGKGFWEYDGLWE